MNKKLIVIIGLIFVVSCSKNNIMEPELLQTVPVETNTPPQTITTNFPAAPSTLSCTKGTFNQSIRLSWSAVPGVTVYNIYRSYPNTNTWSLLATKTNLTTFDYSTVYTINWHFFKVKSIKSNVLSKDSSPVQYGWANEAALPAVLTVLNTTTTIVSIKRYSSTNATGYLFIQGRGGLYNNAVTNRVNAASWGNTDIAAPAAMYRPCTSYYTAIATNQFGRSAANYVSVYWD